MRALFFLRYSHDQASSRVRGLYITEELKRRGIGCKIIYGYDKKMYLSFLSGLITYDIVYFQKRYSKNDIRLNRIARVVGKKTVFDMDDAPSEVNLNPGVEEQAGQMMKYSSAVIVGSHKLRDFAQNFNNHVYIIPTSINLNYYKPKKETKNHVLMLGWIGNGIAYKKDLLMLIRPIEAIGEKYNIKLAIIGALEQEEIHQGFGKMKNVVVKIIDSINWADPTAVPSAISDFDVGLYPLLDNKYNQYKCGFKALEYMAMEIPVVASPVGENRIIVENGKNGFLASNEKEWEEKLSYLIENGSVRKRMGKMGRENIKKNYSLEICVSKLIKVFEEI